ncbi:SDR family NAD(P)-dependent oxidoreductase [Butyrivibrio sp. VCB2006]|nr:SDR family NAD(P)-dependent oxidoreductase [Butyrivibrio sp. VCB2006]
MKTAVITGSTRGLGYEMAKVFVNNGWNVVINGVNEGSL